jgi:3-phosphoshikimate 1-carboxyvinyltransferase
MKEIIVRPGRRKGTVSVPRSKSHEHRLLIADFLAGDLSRMVPCAEDCDDIVATKRCLSALSGSESSPVLDCGESGSTRRFIAPIAAALGKNPVYKMAGRLADRPHKDYSGIMPGDFILEGNVSSQFVTGLLFALPLLNGDSSIRFSSPLQSAGYVEMTLDVLLGASIAFSRTDEGFDIPGSQLYRSQKDVEVERDWSSAAFWYAMNALGSSVEVSALPAQSHQPDKAIQNLADDIVSVFPSLRKCIDVSSCPDLCPALSVVAAASEGETFFKGVRRLRLKESDRIASMADVIRRFGAELIAGDDDVVVRGRGELLNGGTFSSFGDHRIAMAIAVGATVASGDVQIDDVSCVAKSYPSFFDMLEKLSILES